MRGRQGENLITSQQTTQFVSQGYIQVSEAVPQEKLRKALRAINHSIGTVGKTGADANAFRGDSLCFELRKSELLLDLFHGTQVQEIAENLLGSAKVKPLPEVQIAPIFPLQVGEPAPRVSGHLDAVGTGTNGSPVGSYVRDFTLIVVIYLVDILESFSGNFTVWPGSHIETRDFFRTHGYEILTRGDPSIPIAARPRMLTGKAGDAVLAHHLLQHVGGPNTSPQVRHAVIGRMAHVNVAELGYGGFTNMWQEFEGISQFTASFA